MPISDTVHFVPGARSHIEARELHGLWRPLAEALAGLDAAGRDVIVDAGRLGMADSPQVLLERADLTLLVTRTDLPAIAATRSHADLVVRTSPWQRAGLVAVGPGRPYSARGAAKFLGLPLAGSIPLSPQDAAVYSQGATTRRQFYRRRFHKGAFVRSLHSMARTLHDQVATGTPLATPTLTEPERHQDATDVDPRAVWTAAADRGREHA